MERTEINGSKVVFEFEVLYLGWEVDPYGWVTEDGKMWHTNHGGLIEIEPSDMHERIKEAADSIAGIMKAIELHNKIRS